LGFIEVAAIARPALQPGDEIGLFGTSLSIVARGLNCDPVPPQFRRRLGRVSGVELPGCIRVLEGEAAMGPARPQNEQDRRLDSQPLAAEESVQESVDVLSLIEENARLRGLVVKLSELVLKDVLDKENR
jgi:hypothetical protein